MEKIQIYCIYCSTMLLETVHEEQYEYFKNAYFSVCESLVYKLCDDGEVWRVLQHSSVSADRNNVVTYFTHFL